mmetsp:Transcript_26575/g.76284  ORF Transcript_26575/g.76284 Transcript_26575/m.76284 type:complete len:1065 (+) Transcript_26575:182-3376(+)
MVHVRVSTTEEGHENWAVELDVEQGTTVARLKELLAGPPHHLPVPSGNKVLERRGSLLMGLPDKKPVTPEVALLGFVPETAPKAQAAVLPAPAKIVAPGKALVSKVAVKVSTTIENFHHWHIELQVPKDTTIAEFKRILVGNPHNLKLPTGQRVLQRLKNQSYLSGTKDSDRVMPELVLLNFNPEGVSEKPAVKAVAPQEARVAAASPQVSPQSEELTRMELIRRVRKQMQDHFAYLKRVHLEEEPAARLANSYARTISFGVGYHAVVSGTARPVTTEEPRVIWVLNSTDLNEVVLARQDFLKDANWQDRYPTEVVLLGHEVDELQIDEKPSPPGGVFPRIRTANYAAIGRERRPDVVFLLMPQMGMARSNGSAPSSGPAEVPKEVLAACRGAPIILSLRRSIPYSTLGYLSGRAKVILGPTRCPFSALAGREGAEFDENGWVLGVQDPESLVTVLKIDMLPEFSETPGTSGEPETRSPALFWGIIDLKYDTSAPIHERVKMLETGDGRTSRFSGAGAVILKRYKEKYRLEEVGGTGKSAAISANKKLTHDLMVQHGYKHLVPRQVCFNRVYSPDLAPKIMEGLEVGECDVVVLKLCNRTRAAGVLPVPVLDLDHMLKRLLCLPKDFDGWLSRESSKADAETLGISYGCLEEQIRHWWSNECPFFVVERLASSVPTASSWSGEQREYDGTMRVAFALHRKDKQSQKSTRSDIERHVGAGSQTMPPPDEIEIDWLGGYWKLPKEPTESCKLRESIISAAKTGTTYVDTNHLLEVFAAMADSVQQLFGGSEPLPATLAERYAGEPELASYLVGRIGIAMRDLSSIRRTVDLARKVLEHAEDGPSKQCAQSFISRGFGVVDGMTPPGRWTEAQAHFQRSIESLPANASSVYLQGQAYLELGQTELAVDFMRRAMILDLDFRAPYVNLGVAYLRLQAFDAAIAVSEACLKRHPDSPQCNYHIALACYHKSLQMEEAFSRPTSDQKREYDSVRARGFHELCEARDSDEAQRLQHRNRVEAPWLEEDDSIQEALKQGAGFLGRKRDPKIRAHRLVEVRPDMGWRFLGWRT